MVQIHSPRPSLVKEESERTVEPILYRHAQSRRPPGVRPGGPWFKLNRSDYGISRFLIDVHCDSVMFGNTWKLSNLSNTCLTTSPTDKESGYWESGVDAESVLESQNFWHQVITKPG